MTKKPFYELGKCYPMKVILKHEAEERMLKHSRKRDQVQKEIQRLATFLLENYQDEIGRDDPKRGESAVDVAIRLLSKRKREQRASFSKRGEKLYKKHTPKHCPACGGTEMDHMETGEDDYHAPGYDTFCKSCKWSGDISPDMLESDLHAMANRVKKREA